MLTQEKVKELFNYKDGKLFWRVGNNCKVKKGDEGGCVGAKGYHQIRFAGASYRTHRIIWLYHHGYFPENDIDHIDRDTLNNRIENLREVSRSCNLRNANLSKKNTSGVKGVYWCKRNEKWMSKVGVNGILYSLAGHKDFLEAVYHRLAAEQCLGWEGCDSSSPAFQYVQKHINKGPNEAL